MSSNNIFSQDMSFEIVNPKHIDLASGFFFARSKDNKKFYRLFHDDPVLLDLTMKYPERSDIHVTSDTNNPKTINAARILDDEPNHVKDYNGPRLKATIIIRGLAPSPDINRSITSTADNPKVNEDNGTVFYNRRPTGEMKDYPTDREKKTAEAQVAGISFNDEGVGIFSGGSKVDVTSDKVHIAADKFQISGNETNHGMMFTTWMNLLDHYFIGIANTVALPMPHMPNIPKMVAIGKQITSIASAAKTVTKTLRT